jgi:hypothetical protein
MQWQGERRLEASRDIEGLEAHANTAGGPTHQVSTDFMARELMQEPTTN